MKDRTNMLNTRHVLNSQTHVSIFPSSWSLTKRPSYKINVDATGPMNNK